MLICYGIIEDVQESEISTNSDASVVCESPYACNVPVEHSIREQVNESGPGRLLLLYYLCVCIYV